MNEVLYTLHFFFIEKHCFSYNKEYDGQNLDNKCIKDVGSASQCQKLCQKEEKCQLFTYFTSTFHKASDRNGCCLKAGQSTQKYQKGAISGPKNCLEGKSSGNLGNDN